ncbi:MAG: ATPase [Bacteroidota bacterium]|jgi:glucosamine kinase
MILIADSGSSKTDWVLLDKKQEHGRFSSLGLNPNFSSDEVIFQEIEKTFNNSAFSIKVSEIYFYGSGCGNPQNLERVKICLSKIFVNAKVIEVYSDIFGSARALCGNSPGLACILGTGSNSCLYNGEKVIYQSPSYGFIFGDEGSGADIGKRTLQNYFDNTFSCETNEAFSSWINLSHTEIINKIYRQPNANRFIASIAMFHSENLENSEIKILRTESFSAFFEKQIAKIPQAQSYKLSFTGSVSSVFSEEIKTIAQSKKFQVENIFQSPMQGLINFHSK